MARLLWLADVLRAAGLTVHEQDGWRTRGSDDYAPVGVIIHETQGSRSSTDAGEIGVLLNGSSSAPPPIAQLYLSRTGAWWVIASGRCNHALTGRDGPLEGVGNRGLVGIEAAHGQGEPWSAVQYSSYVRGVAALLGRMPAWLISGHKEHQPGEKSDPGFDMNRFRADVGAGGGDDMTPGEFMAINIPGVGTMSGWFVTNHARLGLLANAFVTSMQAKVDALALGQRALADALELVDDRVSDTLRPQIAEMGTQLDAARLEIAEVDDNVLAGLGHLDDDALLDALTELVGGADRLRQLVAALPDQG